MGYMVGYSPAKAGAAEKFVTLDAVHFKGSTRVYLLAAIFDVGIGTVNAEGIFDGA